VKEFYELIMFMMLITLAAVTYLSISRQCVEVTHAMNGSYTVIYQSEVYRLEKIK
jgi:hypothetical protein